MRMRFLPTLSRRSSSFWRAPPLADTMAMTAPMPMTMPRLVNVDRPLLIRRAVKATRRADRKLMARSPRIFLVGRAPVRSRVMFRGFHPAAYAARLADLQHGPLQTKRFFLLGGLRSLRK